MIAAEDPDGLSWREAGELEISLLAELNRQLIADEGHSNRMDRPALAARMRSWLAGDYRATLFEQGRAVVGYACFRPEVDRIYLRQFFVCRSHRRRGFGRRAIAMLIDEVWQPDDRVELDVLVNNHVAATFWHEVGFTDYSRRLVRER